MGIPNKKEDPNSQHGGDMGQYRKLEVDSSMTFELANGIGNDAVSTSLTYSPTFRIAKLTICWIFNRVSDEWCQ